jgi:hypothetical protein
LHGVAADATRGTRHQHVLAGDIVSPGSTREVADIISRFLRETALPEVPPQSASTGKSM